VGTKWFAFNFVSGSGAVGTRNSVLCFDLLTLAGCSAQPYAVPLGSGSLSVGSFPPPAPAAIGSKIIIPIGGNSVTCFDGSALAGCAGSWPIAAGSYAASSYGAPFPSLGNSGSLTGFCLPSPGDPCFDFSGHSANTPSGLPGALGTTDGWNGPAFVLGSRVYLDDGNRDEVLCYDFGSNAGCPNFPKYLPNAGYQYTLNSDPQRPTCIWVNSDDGSGQIQNFDAYTAGACGQGPIRVLASTVVLDTQACAPTSYSSIQVLDPAPGQYTSGSIGFEDGDGNPIAGLTAQPLDASGSVNLSPYNLSTSNGLPQFLITLTGAAQGTSAVTVKLSWQSTGNSSCVIPPDGAGPTTLSTTLSGGGSTSAGISVTTGTGVTDQATLAGTNAATATGTVTYNVYSDAACTQSVVTGSPVSFTNGAVPPSDPVTLSTPGTYYWQAVYSGDVWNGASTSLCGSEVETVTPSVVTGPPNLHAVVQVSTSSIYDGSTAVVSSPDLQAACTSVSFETLQGGSVASPTTSANSISTVVDADGNATVVVDGIGCVPGTYSVLGTIPSSGVSTSTSVAVNPPAITFPYRFGGFPNNEVETGNTPASGHSDVYTTFTVSTSPAYAEDTATISSAALAGHCKGGIRWESNASGSPFVNTKTATAVLDDDGNAEFVFKGASCQAGTNKVTLSVAIGPGTRKKNYATTYTIVAPAVTYTGPQPGMTMNVTPDPLMIIGG